MCKYNYNVYKCMKYGNAHMWPDLAPEQVLQEKKPDDMILQIS